MSSFTASLTLQETAILVGTPFNVSIETDLPADAAADATWNAIVVGADLAIVDEREGTGVPAGFNLTVGEAGNHSIGVTIRAAGYEDAASNATFVVEAIATDVPAAKPEPVVFTGSITAAGPSAYGDVCLLFSMDFMGTGHAGASHDLPDEVAGDWTFQAEPAAVVAWFTNLATEASGGAGNSGTVGEGMTEVAVCSKEPLVNWTLTISPP